MLSHAASAIRISFVLEKRIKYLARSRIELVKLYSPPWTCAKAHRNHLVSHLVQIHLPPRSLGLHRWRFALKVRARPECDAQPGVVVSFLVRESDTVKTEVWRDIPSSRNARYPPIDIVAIVLLREVLWCSHEQYSLDWKGIGNRISECAVDSAHPDDIAHAAHLTA